jgi:hypothetical protein
MTDMGGAIDAPDYAYIKFMSRAVCSYSRFVAFVRAVTWLKKDIIQSLWFYGMEREKKTVAFQAIFEPKTRHMIKITLLYKTA